MVEATRQSSGEWWRGAAIYQIYPRSFQDSDGSGVGDLRGITKRLGHVASLGVDAIWLSPFFRSPMADMGYDVSDYCDVDPMFGSLADFDALLSEAHRLGLKVIIDQVLSHTSNAHPWFVESRSSRVNEKADWYVWADPKPDGTPPNNWLSVFGGSAWEWDARRMQYYLHNFLAEQPDLNFHNPAVQDALLDTVRFWLERGVDGFRLDTVNYYFHARSLADNPPLERAESLPLDPNPYLHQQHLHDKTQPENIDFLGRFRTLLNSFGNRAAIGEVGDEDRSVATVADYTRGNDRLHMCYTFDMLGPAFSAAHVRKCITNFETRVAEGWICWAFSNHDVARHVSRWTRPGTGVNAVARFSIALLSAMRGSICLYQGEELGLEEAELDFEDIRDPFGIRFWPAFKGRDGCRTPMVWEARAVSGGFTTAKPWLPVPETHRALAVDAQEIAAGSVLSFYRTMLTCRRAHPALVSGDLELLDATEHVLAFTRSLGGTTVFCAFNFAETRAEYAIPPQVVNARVLGPTSHGCKVRCGTLELVPLGVFFASVD